MPKVDYKKQPFRLCRWNTRPRDFKEYGYYWCSDGEESVSEDKCMQCFCNTWFKVCSKCRKQFLKTELIYVFLPDFKTGYICNDCHEDEELVNKKPSRKERYIIIDIKEWQELNKEE